MRAALAALAAALLLAAPLASAGVATPDVSSVSGEAIVAQLMKLATFSDDPNPAVTRILFTGAFEDRAEIGRGARGGESASGGGAGDPLP